MQNSEKGLPSIILAGHGILVKMPITLELHVIFKSNYAYVTFYHYRDTGMQNDDKASSRHFLRQSLITVLHTNVPVSR